MKMHPSVLPLLEGGKTVEYGAHLVREEGYRGIPKKIYRDGFLVIGEAAGFIVNLGYTIRGIDLALLSGLAAARAIISAEDAGPAYMKEIENLKLLPSMKAVDGYFDLLEIPRMYADYPGVATDLFEKLYTINGDTPVSIKKQAKEVLKNNRLSLWKLLKDGIRGYRSL